MATSLRVCVLPQGLDASTSEFLRLPHPRTGRPALFLPFAKDGTDGLLEVQAVVPELAQRRSYFVDENVVSDGRLMLFTPIDPIFLLASLLVSMRPKTGSSTDTDVLRAIPLDDLYEEASQAWMLTPVGEAAGPVGEDALRFGALPCVQRALEVICETQDAGSSKAYRLSYDRFNEVMRRKAAAIAAGSKDSPTLLRLLARQGVGDGQGVSEALANQARTLAAVDVLGGYLGPLLDAKLRTCFDFDSLEAYLGKLADDAFAMNNSLMGMPTPSLSSAGGSSSSSSVKPGAVPFGGGKAAALKKQAGKASKGSRGVEALKKVNVSRVKKLDSFFGKAPAKPSLSRTSSDASVATEPEAGPSGTS